MGCWVSACIRSTTLHLCLEMFFKPYHLEKTLISPYLAHAPLSFAFTDNVVTAPPHTSSPSSTPPSSLLLFPRYNERQPAVFTFNLDSPQISTPVSLNAFDRLFTDFATDGKLVYLTNTGFPTTNSCVAPLHIKGPMGKMCFFLN